MRKRNLYDENKTNNDEIILKRNPLTSERYYITVVI